MIPGSCLRGVLEWKAEVGVCGGDFTIHPSFPSSTLHIPCSGSSSSCGCEEVETAVLTHGALGGGSARHRKSCYKFVAVGVGGCHFLFCHLKVVFKRLLDSKIGGGTFSPSSKPLDDALAPPKVQNWSVMPLVIGFQTTVQFEKKEMATLSKWSKCPILRFWP